MSAMGLSALLSRQHKRNQAVTPLHSLGPVAQSAAELKRKLSNWTKPSRRQLGVNAS